MGPPASTSDKSRPEAGRREQALQAQEGGPNANLALKGLTGGWRSMLTRASGLRGLMIRGIWLGKGRAKPPNSIQSPGMKHLRPAAEPADAAVERAKSDLPVTTTGATEELQNPP